MPELIILICPIGKMVVVANGKIGLFLMGILYELLVTTRNVALYQIQIMDFLKL